MKNATMNNNNQIDQVNARDGCGANPITPADRSPQNDATTSAAKRKSHAFLEDLFAGKCNVITL